MQDTTEETKVNYGLVIKKYFDTRRRVYVINASYKLDKCIEQRLTPGLLDHKLFYEESGGLPFGIIGGISEVLLYGIINEIAKTKLIVTARGLIDGLNEESHEVTRILAYETAWRKASKNLDYLLGYVEEFPLIETNPEVERISRKYPIPNADGIFIYRNKIIASVRKKSGIMSADEYFECDGLRVRGTDINKMVLLLDNQLGEP